MSLPRIHRYSTGTIVDTTEFKAVAYNSKVYVDQIPTMAQEEDRRTLIDTCYERLREVCLATPQYPVINRFEPGTIVAGIEYKGVAFNSMTDIVQVPVGTSDNDRMEMINALYAKLRCDFSNEQLEQQAREKRPRGRPSTRTPQEKQARARKALRGRPRRQADRDDHGDNVEEEGQGIQDNQGIQDDRAAFFLDWWRNCPTHDSFGCIDPSQPPANLAQDQINRLKQQLTRYTPDRELTNEETNQVSTWFALMTEQPFCTVDDCQELHRNLNQEAERGGLYTVTALPGFGMGAVVAFGTPFVYQSVAHLGILLLLTTYWNKAVGYNTTKNPDFVMTMYPALQFM